MTAELTTVIGQLSIHGGDWRKDTPNQVAVREPKSADAPGAGKGDLFIVTEIQGNIKDRDALEQRLAHVIRDSYYLARGSVTASLRRAVQAGNDLLYNRNRKVAVEERVAGGVVILSVCQEDAFVAQIGPAAFFAVLGDHIRRYPASSIWLDEALGPSSQEDDISALGLNKLVEPSLHHLRVDLEDILVLADSRLASQLPLKDLVQAVQVGDIRAAVKNLGKAAQAKDCSALVLELVEAAAGPLRLAAPARLSGLFGRQQSQSAVEKETKATKGKKEKTPAIAQPRSRLEVEAEADWETDTHSSPVFASTSIMQKPLQWLGSKTGSDDEAEALEDEAVEIPAAFTEAAEPEQYESRFDISHQSELIDRVAAEEDEPFEHRSSEAGSLGRRIFQALIAPLLLLVALFGKVIRGIFSIIPGSADPEPRQAGRQAQPPPSAVPWGLLRSIAIIIPLLVVLIVGVSYLQKGRLREAEYSEFIATARNKFEQAQAVNGDISAALSLMAESEAALVQAEQIKENQPEIADLRQQMVQEADRISNVQRLYYLPQVRQYTDAGTTMHSIIVQGIEIYVLDVGADRIFHHQLDDTGEALLPDGDDVLVAAKGQEIESIQVGELLDMTWMPTGGNRQTSDLVILNSTGLLEYNPTWGITTSALAGGESLGLPVAVSSYFGNLYILDPQINALLRYLPTPDGYGAQPQSYFPVDQPVDLTGAVDLAIDGAVYILYKDGRITKYLSGQPVEFNLTGLDKPFNNPVAIYTAPDETIQHVYVADAGNQRIVQLNKDGSFVRQFKPRAGESVTFANLQDVFVDEISNRIFILDSNNLYIGKMTTE